MESVWSRIRPKIGIEQLRFVEQCGFVEDTGARNTIFMVRIISKRAIEKQKDVYMCCIITPKPLTGYIMMNLSRC